VRASYEDFDGYHTELYRDLPALLRGGPGRRDTAENGEVIARLAAAVYPLIRDVLVCSAGTLTCCCGRSRAAWNCPPSTCCSIRSAKRAYGRTHRSGSALPPLHSAQ
jgi:hypothetical protein